MWPKRPLDAWHETLFRALGNWLYLTAYLACLIFFVIAVVIVLSAGLVPNLVLLIVFCTIWGLTVKLVTWRVKDSSYFLRSVVHLALFIISAWAAMLAFGLVSGNFHKYGLIDEPGLVFFILFACSFLALLLLAGLSLGKFAVWGFRYMRSTRTPLERSDKANTHSNS